MKSISFLFIIAVIFIALVAPAYAVVIDNGQNSGRISGVSGSMSGNVNNEARDYVPDEVLVKFKDDVDPLLVTQRVNLKAKSIGRVHSATHAVVKFKKDYKLEKDKRRLLSFFGKKYNNISEVSEETIFKKAYLYMDPLRKELYRKYKIILPQGGSVEEAVAKLRKDPNVEFAYPNYIRKVCGTPNDPQYSQQWALPKIGAPAAWDITAGIPEVVIAIIDTGIDYNHQDLFDKVWVNPDIAADRNGDGKIDLNDLDLNGNRIIEQSELNQFGADKDVIGYDFVSVSSSSVASGEDPAPRDNNPMDVLGHGTHCAGIAAAATNNGIGIAGVAPNCRIMAIRAGYKDPSGNGSLQDADIEQAILYAIDNGAKVISMSFGGSNSAAVWADEIKAAYAANIVLVAAAGNDNASSKFYPAAMDGVIAVAATDQNDNKASFSNYGDWVDVAAPGVSILSTLPNNSYASWSGTSMACPHVAGIAALILSKDPTLSNEKVKQIIEYSAADLGDPGIDNYFGYGRIDAQAAAICASGQLFISITFPAGSGVVRGTVQVTGSASLGERFSRYELYYMPVANPTGKTLIVSSASTVQNGLLGTWDTLTCQDGKYLLILKIITTEGKEISCYSYVTVDNVSEPPVLNVSNQGAVIGRNLSFQVTATDPDDPATPWGQLTYSANNLPSNATFNASTQMFSWSPTTADEGTYKVTFTVQDNEHIVSKEITISTVYIQQATIAGGSSRDVDPSIYGNKIVWYDNPFSSNSNVYMYDLTTGIKTKISTTPRAISEINIYDNKVVWANNTDIYMYNIQTGQETRVTNSHGEQDGLSIYGNRIAWGFMDVYYYDLQQQQEYKITTNSAKQSYPSIYGDKIVWEDVRSGNDNIYMYDIPGQIETQLTSKSRNQRWPSIYQNKVTWIDQTDTNNSDVCMLDLLDPLKNVNKLTTAYSQKYEPAIYDNKIAWVDGRNGPTIVDYDIYAYDLTSGTEVRVTSSAANNVNMNIYENKIVWQNYVSGSANGEDIIMAQVFFVPQITAINPTEAAPGSLITIDGINLGGTQSGLSVKFANGASAAVQSVSDNRIVCTVPPRAQVGPVKVTTLGGTSNGINVTVLGCTELPVAPTSLVTVQYAATQVKLVWQDNSDIETAFKIERRTDGTDFNQVGIVDGNVATYIDKDLAPGLTYFYRVRASNSVGDSGYSNTSPTIVDTAPAAPSILAARVASSTMIVLTWKDNSNNEKGFTLERRRKDSPGTVWKFNVDPNMTSYVDTVVTGATFTYQICAYNAAGNSPYSNTVEATTYPPPSAPSNLIATVISPTDISFTWTDNSSNEQGFKLERGLTQMVWNQIDIPTPNATTYTDSGRTPSTKYYYRICAYNTGGYSGYSNTVSPTTFEGTPPTTPVVTDDGISTLHQDRLHASWSSSDPESGIAEYQYTITEGAPGGTVIVGWTSAGTNASATVTGLSLGIGKTYFVGVKAKNGVGSWSNVGYSDGIVIVENKPPIIESLDEKAYYLWNQSIAPGDTQLFMAEVNPALGQTLESKAVQLTVTPKIRWLSPQLEVFGNKIYYAFCEKDNALSWHIWTATSDLNGANFNACKRTDGIRKRNSEPRLQIAGNNIYYLWIGPDPDTVYSYYNQVCIARSGISGDNWQILNHTTDNVAKCAPQFEVTGDMIYYTWYNDDLFSNNIYTAVSDLDGQNLQITKRTDIPKGAFYPDMKAIGTDSYYIWYQYDASSNPELCTAKLDVTTGAWQAVNQRTIDYSSTVLEVTSDTTINGGTHYYKGINISPGVKLTIDGGAIVYVDGPIDSQSNVEIKSGELTTASIVTDTLTLGAGTTLTIAAIGSIPSADSTFINPQLQVQDSKIYYVWTERDSQDKEQIWTAISDLDGTNWLATQCTTTPYAKYYPQLQIDGKKIYYAWQESDPSGYTQIWTAVSALDGSNWVSSQQTTTPCNKDRPQFQVVNDKTIAAGSLLEFTITASDPNDETLELTVQNKPASATFIDNGNNTATFSWTPDTLGIGAHQITFTAKDGGNLTDTRTLTITVIPAA